MSKRHNKSEDEGLPDWADDVTPADEVMRKFYAPTGTFKRGPIVVPGPPASQILPTATTSGVQQNTHQEDFSPSNRAVEPHKVEVNPAAPETPLPPHDLANRADVGSEGSADVEPVVKPEPVRRLNTRRRRHSAPSTLPSPSPVSSAFEQFARRWKRYLYPGQLSVMRVLFEKTVEVDMTECFTRYSELARETKMTRRNCINVINSLVDHGFVERLEVLNEAKGKGIRLKVNTEPHG